MPDNVPCDVPDNVADDVPIHLCTNQCGECLIPGTNGFHKLLISYRSDKHSDQQVMQDPVEKGRIPFKIFDIIEQHARVAPHRDNSEYVLPETYQSEVLMNTNKARGYVAS